MRYLFVFALGVKHHGIILCSFECRETYETKSIVLFAILKSIAAAIRITGVARDSDSVADRNDVLTLTRH